MTVESVEDFRARARGWIRENLEHVGPLSLTLRKVGTDEDELAAVARDRELQRRLFDGGLAGICVPTEYGGQGLTPAHQKALNEELEGYEFPWRLQAPTMTPCMAVILDFGTEEQKQRHVPAILRGEQAWMQFLSEPSSGSDVAGVLTSAVRDESEWVLNGSKIWTTGAWWSDWGLCLARTNWDVPKHRGLTVFMMPIKQAGVDVHRIEMLNGNKEFCQEFISDVRVPDGDRIGEVDDGWTVGTRWMIHERMLYSSPYVTYPVGTIRGNDSPSALLDVARSAGRADDAHVRDLIGEAIMLDLVGDALKHWVGAGIATRTLNDNAASMVRLFSGVAIPRQYTIAFEIAGDAGAAWEPGTPSAERAVDYLTRQASAIGGGTTEIARNVIAERLLGMPREAAADVGIAFRDVPRRGRA